MFSILFFLSLFHWLVYTCNPGTFNLIFNILFFFSVIFIGPLTLFSHRSGTFLLHEVNSSCSGSFILFFPCSFYYIYVVNYDILFYFFLLRIRTIVNLWSRNKIDYLEINLESSNEIGQRVYGRGMGEALVMGSLYCL